MLHEIGCLVKSGKWVNFCVLVDLGGFGEPKTAHIPAGVWSYRVPETARPQEFPKILGGHWLCLGHGA